MTRIPGRLAVAAAILAAGVTIDLTSAPAAGAHVSVGTTDTTAGGYTVLTFHAPTESDTASTVSLTVQLPTGHPFTSVSYQPVPGWSAHLVTSKLPKPRKDDDGNTIDSAVTQVVWTATDGGLKPGEFGEFPISVGPLPGSGTVSLPVIQKYSDGTEADWVQQTQGSTEPEHPAPSFRVTPKTAAPTTTAERADDSTAAPAATNNAASSLDRWAVGLGVAGTVIALAVAAAGAVVLRRART